MDYAGEPADLMVALHAWRSSDAIARFAHDYPDRPLVVALTGTDAYSFIHSHPETTLGSIALAHRLVGLHDLIGETVPPEHRAKVRVIYQSARPIAARQPAKRGFRVCVAGHLREEKDPLRPAIAVRDLPPASRLRVDHYGAAHTPDWAAAAQAEMAINPRYRWHGEVPQHRLAAGLRARPPAGAAVADGGRGQRHLRGGGRRAAGHRLAYPRLRRPAGRRLPRLLPGRGRAGLRELLLRAETDAAFYRSLEAACAARRHLFTPEAERAAWAALLRDL